MHSSRKGFTIVEIMVVTAIIALITAIAIPNLLRARISANESAAIAALKTLSSAFESYRAVNPVYPRNFLILKDATPPYINYEIICRAGGLLSDWIERQGYRLDMVISGAPYTYRIDAYPLTAGKTGNRRFRILQDGTVNELIRGIYKPVN